MSLEEIKSLVLALSPEDQLRLLDDISDNLNQSIGSSELTDEQRAELDRRIVEANANPELLIPHDEVMRRLSKYS